MENAAKVGGGCSSCREGLSTQKEGATDKEAATHKEGLTHNNAPAPSHAPTTAK